MATPTSLFDPQVQQVIDDARNRAHMPEAMLRQRNLRRPFPSPDDWRDIQMYFLMIDRFNGGPAAPDWNRPYSQRHGGTIVGITNQLQYLRDLGINAIWVTPPVRNPAASYQMTYHGYGFQDLLAIDERWASDGRRSTAEQELQDMVQKAHDLGIYVILDIVLNHTGLVFYYERNGMVERTFEDKGLLTRSRSGGALPNILWTNGFGQHQTAWRDVIPPGEGHCPDDAIYPVEFRDASLFRRRGSKVGDNLADYPGLGFVPGDFGDMRQLNVEYEAASDDPLRQYGRNPTLALLLRAYQYLVARYDFDGLRIDTVKYIDPKLIQRFGNAMNEFAYSIGKKFFLVFGEVWDSNKNIAGFVGRNGSPDTRDPDGGFGIDAALDFPLCEAIRSVCTGPLEKRSPVSLLRDIYDERRKYEDELISSHGDASNYFVTFCDNHDRHQRIRHPYSPDAEVRLCLALLYTLPGIPCLYYGTEQDLDGTRDEAGQPKLDSFESVREALWGRYPGAWPTTGGTYQMLKALCSVRQNLDPLRYGRHYFRQVSGNGIDFGWPMEQGGVFAMSRIHCEREVLVVANTSPFQTFTGRVEIDADLVKPGLPWRTEFSTVFPVPPSFSTVRAANGRITVQLTLRSNELVILTQ